MITVNNTRVNRFEQSIDDLVGLSTDTKPIKSSIENGSTFYEMDTKKVYMFDKENQIWLEQ